MSRSFYYNLAVKSRLTPEDRIIYEYINHFNRKLTIKYAGTVHWAQLNDTKEAKYYGITYRAAEKGVRVLEEVKFDNDALFGLFLIIEGSKYNKEFNKQ